MLKLKVLFSIFMLLAIQQVISTTQTEERDCPCDVAEVIEISFEANTFMPGIFGDIPSGRLSVNFSVAGIECFTGKTKSKEILSGLSSSLNKSKLQFGIAQSSFYTRYHDVLIPIYLHTASFLL